MSIASIRKELAHDTKVKVAGLDVDGVLRGKIMNKDKFISLIKDETEPPEFGFCGALVFSLVLSAVGPLLIEVTRYRRRL